MTGAAATAPDPADEILRGKGRVCPCCKGPWKGEDQPPTYVEQYGKLYFDGGEVHIRPQAGRVYNILRRARPDPVSNADLVDIIYADARHLPDDPEKIIHVAVNALRTALQNTGWRIRVVYKHGYILERVPS